MIYSELYLANNTKNARSHSNPCSYKNLTIEKPIKLTIESITDFYL